MTGIPRRLLDSMLVDKLGSRLWKWPFLEPLIKKDLPVVLLVRFVLQVLEIRRDALVDERLLLGGLP